MKNIEKNIVEMQILRPLQVMELLGLSRPTLYRLRKEGRFPNSIKLGEKSIGWMRKDIENWIKSKFDESI